MVPTEPRRTLANVADDLAAGRVSSRELVSDCLTRITDPAGEGVRTFLKVHAQTALSAAEQFDRLQQRGARPGRYAGIPISIKDLFDMAGDVTLAGSTLLRDSAPAQHDAPAVARLRAAGFILIGRTNMTEFAFSGIGINPHYGTPANPWDRTRPRIPGGSSSGAAVSVADAMAVAALGTDTGGSCRIPAALCGLVGFKPTAHRVPRLGTYPLSMSLDSIGPIANSVGCCATIDTIISGGQPAGSASAEKRAAALTDLHLGVLVSYVTDSMDASVSAAYEAAIRRLADQGVRLSEVHIPELSELPPSNQKGGISSAEAYAFHRHLLSTRGAEYDPRVAARILRGREQGAADYIDLLNFRASFIQRVTSRIAGLDAVIMPTTAIVAPALSELQADEAYWRLNGLLLRNTSIVNFLDGCAISLPCHQPGTPPVGMSLFGRNGTDRHLLTVAAAVEATVAAGG